MNTGGSSFTAQGPGLPDQGGIRQSRGVGAKNTMEETSRPSAGYARKRVLITGGLGFIGSTLAAALVRDGAEVTIVDSLIPEYGGLLANIAGIEDKVRVNISDVRDEQSMLYLVQGQGYLFSKARPQADLLELFSDREVEREGRSEPLRRVAGSRF